MNEVILNIDMNSKAAEKLADACAEFRKAVDKFQSDLNKAPIRERFKIEILVTEEHVKTANTIKTRRGS